MQHIIAAAWKKFAIWMIACRKSWTTERMFIQIFMHRIRQDQNSIRNFLIRFHNVHKIHPINRIYMNVNEKIRKCLMLSGNFWCYQEITDSIGFSDFISDECHVSKCIEICAYCRMWKNIQCTELDDTSTIDLLK